MVSGISDPSLVLESDWMQLFTAFYTFTGIGALVEVNRQDRAQKRGDDRA